MKSYRGSNKYLTPSRMFIVPVVSACMCLAGCSDNNENVDVKALMALISDAGITGDPTTGRTLPAVDAPKVVLGKKLFFTKGLGGNDDSACVTCHHPTLGGGDDLSLPIGVGAEASDLLGPGRVHDINVTIATSPSFDGGEFDGGPTVPRNAPTTFNLAMWDQALFHDGRVESLGKTAGANGNDGAGIRTPDSAFGVADPDSGVTLAAAQSRFPVTSPEEMRGFTFAPGSTAGLRTALETKLTALGGWDAEFAAAFGDAAITYPRIAEAIGEYERSQVFVDTPWKAFVEGDENAISESAKRGAMLFFNTDVSAGGSNCVSCHSGDFFTDELYHVLATPQIGRGKGNDNGTLTNDDFGRSRETGDNADKYKFRTPTLLNVEVTGPWGHAGAYTTLENMVHHMLNPHDAINNYDFSQLNPTIQASDMLTNTQFALDQLAANRTNGVANVHQADNLLRSSSNANDPTEIDVVVADLVEFLKTLTDPCVKDRDCLAPWIPDAGDTNPDGLRLNAVNNSGSFL
jgi:cytochrome c peroxidase